MRVCWPAKRLVPCDREEWERLKQENTLKRVSGTIVQIVGLPPGTERDSIEAELKAAKLPFRRVDFKRGQLSAFVRSEQPATAVELVKAVYAPLRPHRPLTVRHARVTADG